LLSPLASGQTTKYDLYFKHWGQYYAPWQDWKEFKAQGLAESGLNPKAVSYCGAQGIMQLMPATARELGANPFDPESNIQGGIKFDSQLWKMWKGAKSQRELMFGSYNAGPGNIQKAVKGCGSTSWKDVSGYLSKVTGKNATQTINYIEHIDKFYKVLIAQ
jgi:soluble lytic murein transglycosylase-like protein